VHAVLDLHGLTLGSGVSMIEEAPVSVQSDSLRAKTAALEEIAAQVESLRVNVHGEGQLWELVRDHEQRFDTLQSPLWKRLLFRLDGWPGQRDLNAARRSWRPWH
jgi:hypothetical protein